MRVITNHLGFRNGHAEKRLIVEDVPEARSIFGTELFQVFEQNEFSKYGQNDPRQQPFIFRGGLQRERGDFGSWLVGDFSHLTDTGIYQGYCGNEPSPNFAIRDDVWTRLLPELCRFFEIMSCGKAVVGWHDTCHLDDAYLAAEDRHVNAVGGWHDAGDFRKWATSTSMNAHALLMAHRLWSGREERLGLAPGIFRDLALQGLDYFLNIQDEETGALLHNIGGGGESYHDNLDCRYTDNIRESGDERLIWPGFAGPAGRFTTLFALYAQALKASDPDKSARCLAAARASERYDRTGGENNADHLQWRAWASLELWRCEGREEDRTAAAEALDQLLDLQVTDYVGGQSEVRGFFRSGRNDGQYHHKHVGASYPVIVAAEMIEAFPDHPKVARWRDAIELWVEDYVLKFTGRNPFGWLPYAFYPEPPADNPHLHYRPLGDRLFFRYFMKGKMGVNARFSLDAVALGAAARVTGRKELVSKAYRLLEAVIGNNPFQISTLTGFGLIQPCALSFQMGNVPGGVTMGVQGDARDQPFYPHPWESSDEYYGYQSSQYLWAVLSLQTLDL